MASTYLKRNKLADLISVDAAGVSIDGEPASPSWPVSVLSLLQGVRFTSERRQVSKLDLDRSQLVVALDSQCLHGLKQFSANPDAKIKLLSEFLGPGWPPDVPDPMMRSFRTCNFVLRMIKTAIPEIVTYVREDMTGAENVGRT